jgi:hypothetical protein
MIILSSFKHLFWAYFAARKSQIEPGMVKLMQFEIFKSSIGAFCFRKKKVGLKLHIYSFLEIFPNYTVIGASTFI